MITPNFWKTSKKDSKEQFIGINIDLKYWNSQKNNILGYMNDPTFRNINRLFVVSFKMVAMILEKILFISIICH